ncbi:oxygen tolerance protein BatD [Larkinella arboricola]|uniref:Oxygen tolerance protein BatD n=1 Tax=Larkinella arboricola TaxID=643671 RepID=A0A327WX52_LARAB|nr:BatD family protein [Larkinella arboricola]RAJ97749.1 oxygen tolerance protein BatD [Larkinella arboricola]
MKFSKFQLLVALFFYGPLNLKGLAQERSVAIEIGETDISIERPFTISVIIKNSDSRPIINFPAIKGFIKKGTTTSVTPAEINGKTVVSQLITQSYSAVGPGQYRLPPFELVVGETTIQSEEVIITVRPPLTSKDTLATEVVTPAAIGKNDAFLSLSTSKHTVYTGEGFSLKLSFFVAESYPLELTFYELDQQLQQLLKTLRPANCWEENEGITDLTRHPVLLNGKRFMEYRIYRATFFPLNKQSIRIPAVSLKLLQYGVAAKPGGERKKEIVSFATSPLAITVTPLPPHPLRDQVAVGQYRLLENILRKNPAVGQSVQYNFRITGEGNIASLSAPTLSDSTTFDIFPPSAKESINRSGGRVSGYKNFSYALIPRRNGKFPLASYFQWIYFNLKQQRYDTLRSAITLRVGGTALSEGDTVQISLPGSIYTGIEQTDSSRQPINFQELVRFGVNILLVGMILGMMYLFWKK